MSDEGAPSAEAAATRAASARDAASGGDASVEILGSNSRRVSARVVVPASADVVWGVLTDYERLADFIPSLATNQMLQRRSNGARLLQVGEQDVAMGIKFRAKVVVVVDVTPADVAMMGIKFRAKVVVDARPTVGEQDVAMGIKFRAKVVVDVEEGEEERLPRDLPRSFSSTDCSSSSSSSGEESDAVIGRVGGSIRRRCIHFKMVEGDFQKFVGVWTLDEQMVEGDFQKFVGVWTLEEQLPGSPSGPTTLSYSVELTPHTSGCLWPKWTRFQSTNPPHSLPPTSHFLPQLPGSPSGPTTLSYSVELTPHFWLPVALVEGRISKEIKANLAGVRQEAYRRIQVALSQV
ncbi:unnamed protein product [Closterium sp. NIES-64]|nr:unnamed protein product [Closterium sp. NIES-64]